MLNLAGELRTKPSVLLMFSWDAPLELTNPFNLTFMSLHIGDCIRRALHNGLPNQRAAPTIPHF